MIHWYQEKSFRESVSGVVMLWGVFKLYDLFLNLPNCKIPQGNPKSLILIDAVKRERLNDIAHSQRIGNPCTIQPSHNNISQQKKIEKKAYKAFSACKWDSVIAWNDFQWYE